MLMTAFMVTSAIVLVCGLIVGVICVSLYFLDKKYNTIISDSTAAVVAGTAPQGAVIPPTDVKLPPGPGWYYYTTPPPGDWFYFPSGVTPPLGGTPTKPPGDSLI